MCRVFSLSPSLSLSLPPVSPSLSGHGQTANCFTDAAAPFSCSGAPGGQRNVGQQCCDDGYLAFAVTGSEDCTICYGKI